MLDWIDTLGLLSHDTEWEWLDLFWDGSNNTSKRTVIIEIVGQLSPTPGTASNASSKLDTWPKLKQLMMIIGQAFRLPLDDIQVIGKVTEVYGEWLVNPETRPPGAKANEDEFLQLVLRQLSNLFEIKRLEGKGSLAQHHLSKHVEVCRQAVKAMVSCHNFTGLTQKTLLHVLLGVTDYLLRLPMAPVTPLADELTETLLAGLLEAWLRGQTMGAEAWKSLKTYYARWCHRTAAVAQWTVISLALTQRIGAHLYGNGTDYLAYNLNKEQTVKIVEINPQFELFAWKHHLGLLAKASDMPSGNSLRAILGIEMIIQQLDLNASKAQGAFADGNTLLALFGRYLFDAASMTSPEYDETVAHASGILCRIFSRQQHRKSFHTGFLNQFYAVLQGALNHPNLLVVVFICINCEELFCSRLEGVRILAIPFLHALRRLVPRPQSALQLNIQMEDLRRACYKLLCMLLSFSNHFDPSNYLIEEVTLSNTYSDGLVQVFPSKSDAFKFLVLDTLISSLLVETDQGNRRYLLNSLTTLSIDLSPTYSTLVPLIVKLYGDFLVRCDPSVDAETTIVALESLRQLASLQHQTLPDESVSAAIGAICESITAMVKSKTMPVLHVAIECLLDWVCISSYAGLFSTCEGVVSRVMQSIELLFSLGKEKTDVAQLALTRLISRFGLAANPLMPGLASSRLNEFDFLRASVAEDMEAASESLHYFILNEAVLGCFVECAGTDFNGQSSSHLALILRTPTGRFCWKSSLILDESEIVDLKDGKSITALWQQFKSLNISAGQKTLPKGDFPTDGPLFNDYAFNKAQLESDQKRQKNISLVFDLVQKQELRMAECWRDNSPAFNANSYTPPAVLHPKDKLTRLLLAHFGFLAPENLWFLQPIPSSSDLFTEVQSLDELPERETVSISVFFVRSGKQSQEEILRERRIPSDFLLFLKSLGWPVDNGPDGIINFGDALGSTVPYWADQSNEIVYHVAPILPLDRAAPDATEIATQLSAITSTDPVVILFLQDSEDLLSLPGKLASQSATVFICVIPMSGAGSDGLYRLRIMVTAAPSSPATGFTFGPLLDGMVLRREMLGPLVRATALSAALFCLYRLNPSQAAVSPAAARSQFILDLARNYAAGRPEDADLYSELLFFRPTRPAAATVEMISAAGSVAINDAVGFFIEQPEH